MLGESLLGPSVGCLESLFVMSLLLMFDSVCPGSVLSQFFFVSHWYDQVMTMVCFSLVLGSFQGTFESL